MFKVQKILLLVSMMIGQNLAAQSGPALPLDTLAIVGRTIVTARDLIERIELMPWPEKDKPKQHDSAKVRALASLVAEKLLALEAQRLRLGEDRRTRLMEQGLENLLIRDELYRREVLGGISVTSSEINAALTKFASELRVIVFSTGSSFEAVNVRREMMRSGNIDSVLRHLPRSRVLEWDTLTVNFGGLDPVMEQAAYSLRKGAFSEPVRSEYYGWTILYLLEGHSNPISAGMSLADQRRRVEKVLRRRKEIERANELFKDVLSTKTATTDSVMFQYVAVTIRNVFLEDTTAHRNANGSRRFLPVIDEVLTRLQSYLDDPLVSLGTDVLTVGEVIEMMRYGNLMFTSLEGNIFLIELNQEIKRVVEGSFLTREGLNKKLQNTEQVRRGVTVWQDYWRSHSLWRQLFDTLRISDEELRNFMVKNKELFGGFFEVNVRELLSRTLDEAAAAVEELERGADFRWLASRTMRKEWSANNGESGYFRVVQYPEIGFAALDSDTGKLMGPLKLPEGYSMFVVLGKRQIQPTVTYDTLKQNVRRRLLNEKRESVLNKYIADLAREYAVRLFPEKLKGVQISPSNMFTRRFIGFGGVMTAVPLLYPEWEWLMDVEPALRNFP